MLGGKGEGATKWGGTGGAGLKANWEPGGDEEFAEGKVAESVHRLVGDLFRVGLSPVVFCWFLGALEQFSAGRVMDGASVVCFGETKSGLGEAVSWLLFLVGRKVLERR